MRRAKYAAVIVSSLVLLAGTIPDASAIKITGGAGNEMIAGSKKRDKLDGGGGNDIVFGKNNPKRSRGRRAKPEIVRGGTGVDVLLGGRGRDVMSGGPDADTIIDGDHTSRDALFGDDGADLIVSADNGNDRVDCGLGADVAIVDDNDVVSPNCESVVDAPAQGTPAPELVSGVWVFISTDEATNLFTPGGGFTYFFAMRGGNDSVTTAPTDTVRVLGGTGRDVASGSTGNDLFYDDDGTSGDAYTGGAGNDIFYVADGAIDAVTCGDGTDKVYADAADIVTDPGACESVVRVENGSAPA